MALTNMTLDTLLNNAFLILRYVTQEGKTKYDNNTGERLTPTHSETLDALEVVINGIERELNMNLTHREAIVDSAVRMAAHHFTNPDIDLLTTKARECYEYCPRFSAIDIAYLVIRYYRTQTTLELNRN